MCSGLPIKIQRSLSTGLIVLRKHAANISFNAFSGCAQNCSHHQQPHQPLSSAPSKLSLQAQECYTLVARKYRTKFSSSIKSRFSRMLLNSCKQSTIKNQLFFSHVILSPSSVIHSIKDIIMQLFAINSLNTIN